MEIFKEKGKSVKQIGKEMHDKGFVVKGTSRSYNISSEGKKKKQEEMGL